jgi:DNA polymerase III subunit delta
VNLKEALTRAQQGEVWPVYLIAGTEHVLRDKLVRALRESVLAGGLAEFNEDKFSAGEVPIERVIAAAQTLPMMSPKRFVLVRNLERWDTGDAASAAFEALAGYAEAPSESTCLVLLCDKLDGRRKLAANAKKKNFLVPCEPLDERELVRYIEELAKERNAEISSSACERIARLVGPDLAPIADAIERLSLYVGPGKSIDEDAIAVCVTRIRTEDTWALVDHIGRGDIARALFALADVYDPRDRGLPLVGALAWSFRQLLKLKLGEARGMRTDDAARAAGIFQPNRARELSIRGQALGTRELERWLTVLAHTDQELKRSRRPAEYTLETMILKLAKR